MDKPVELELEIFKSGITLDNRKIKPEYVQQLFYNSKAVLDEQVRIPLRLAHTDPDPESKGEITELRLVEDDSRMGKKIRINTPKDNIIYRIFAKCRMQPKLFELFIAGKLPERSIGLSTYKHLPSGKEIALHIDHLAFDGTTLGALQHLQNPEIAFNIFDVGQYGYYFCNQHHEILNLEFSGGTKMEKFNLDNVIAIRDAVAEVLKMAEEMVKSYPDADEKEKEKKEGATPKDEMPEMQNKEEKKEECKDEYSNSTSAISKIQRDIETLVKHKNQMEKEARLERQALECETLFTNYVQGGKLGQNEKDAFSQVFSAGGQKLVETVYGTRSQKVPPAGGETPSHRFQLESADEEKMRKEMIYSFSSNGFNEDDISRMMKIPKEKILEISMNGRN